MVGAGVENFISEIGKSIPVRVVYFPMFQLDQKKKQPTLIQNNNPAQETA